MQAYKINQELHKVYDGNILNNFVPVLDDLILIKITGRMNINMD